ncbi:MAG: metalloregulator ArsR/SmtB family transcription factor [Pseudomonadota bacterium]
MNTARVQELADLLKALGEFNRLSMVYELCQCKAPQNAMCLCECCGVDASGVSRHLKVLSQEGVVSSERKGRAIQYSLNRESVANQLRQLADLIETGQPLETLEKQNERQDLQV